MKRYFREVRTLTPREFVKKVFGGETPAWFEIQAGYRIFREDGGKMRWEEWLTYFPEYQAPVEDRAWIEGKKPALFQEE
jgi:hypothetical protein